MGDSTHPPGGGGDQHRGGAQAAQEGGQPLGLNGGGTYAAKTSINGGLSQAKNKVKLNILDIILERRNQSISFNLNKDELSKLLFQRMKLNPNNVVKIDTSAFGKIHLELKPNVKPEEFMNFPAFDIRDGLRTKLYKPHHRKDVLVTVSWLDLETPDDFLTYVLSFFGKIKSGVQYMKIKEEPGESKEAQLLNNILSGERKIWMEVDKPIPSYAVINGRRIKIFYNGQKRTCARCCKYKESCPGESNAKLCEENGGEKVKTEIMWKATLESVNYAPWAGEETEVTVTEATIDDENVDIPKFDEGKFDGLTLDNLKENSSDTDIMELLLKVVTESELENVSILPTGSTKSKILRFPDPKVIPAIWKKIDKKVIEGRMIHSRPHVPLTPPKSTQTPTPSEEKPSGSNSGKKTPAKQSSLSPQPSLYIPPGLPKEDVIKAAKKVKNKQKKKGKPKPKKVRKDGNISEKKSSEMVKVDFLYGSDDSTIDKTEAEKVKEFGFSDYETDSDTDSDTDAFEDSKEDVDESEPEADVNSLFTPLRWKSRSAANIAMSVSVSKDTPRSRAQSDSRKRPLTSPKKEENKKMKNSFLPVKSAIQSSVKQ